MLSLSRKPFRYGLFPKRHVVPQLLGEDPETSFMTKINVVPRGVNNAFMDFKGALSLEPTLMRVTAVSTTNLMTKTSVPPVAVASIVQVPLQGLGIELTNSISIQLDRVLVGDA